MILLNLKGAILELPDKLCIGRKKKKKQERNLIHTIRLKEGNVPFLLPKVKSDIIFRF